MLYNILNTYKTLKKLHRVLIICYVLKIICTNNMQRVVNGELSFSFSLSTLDCEIKKIINKEKQNIYNTLNYTLYALHA